MLPGVNELILTVVVILLLFGATRVPKVVKHTGKTLYEYKKGQNEGEEGLRQIEQRIKEIEKQNAGEGTSDIHDLNLNNVVKKAANKEYALMALGLLLVVAGVLLVMEKQIWGEITLGVAILLGVSGIVLIAIGKKFG